MSQRKLKSKKFKEANKTLSKKHEIEGKVAVGGVTSDDLESILKGKTLNFPFIN